MNQVRSGLRKILWPPDKLKKITQSKGAAENWTFSWLGRVFLSQKVSGPEPYSPLKSRHFFYRQNMTKQEILGRLKPVLDAELYSAIETVFKHDDKLTNAVAVLQDAFNTEESPKQDSASRHLQDLQDCRDYHEVQEWMHR